MIQLKMRCLDRPLLHLEWIWSEGPNLKVKPRDTSREPVHSKVGELSNSAHTACSKYKRGEREVYIQIFDACQDLFIFTAPIDSITIKGNIVGQKHRQSHDRPSNYYVSK